MFCTRNNSPNPQLITKMLNIQIPGTLNLLLLSTGSSSLVLFSSCRFKETKKEVGRSRQAKEVTRNPPKECRKVTHHTQLTTMKSHPCIARICCPALFQRNERNNSVRTKLQVERHCHRTNRAHCVCTNPNIPRVARHANSNIENNQTCE